MDNASYAALTRQSGLLQEMQVVANNVANSANTGFRAEQALFSEYVNNLGPTHPSLSMATARIANTIAQQGVLEKTGAPFDLAIEGEGFFRVQTPQGERLTRAGNFGPNQNGDLVNADGYPVLDVGGAPVFVPVDAGPVRIGSDGTISAGGQPVGQIGVVVPVNSEAMRREGGTVFVTEDGVNPADNPRVLQGFLEASNVNPTLEIARMIEVQRAYELGQSFLDKEDERIRTVLRTLGQ